MNLPTRLVACCVCAIAASIAGISTTMADEVVDQWKYTLERPADAWHQVDFDDTAWKDGLGGFGSKGASGARVNTTWLTKNIWLRKAFTLKDVPANPGLLVHHDEDAQVYLNGELVASFKGWLHSYKVIPLEDSQSKAIRVGQNVLAVHCRQTGGHQFIDVHVVDVNDVPKLPRPKRSTKPFLSELITTWGAELTSDDVWTEYPRPLLRREQWQNLNGHWDYTITKADQHEMPSDWTGKILVPFCLESKLGGVSHLLDESEALWYRRHFTLSPTTEQRTILNFEAVDYRCEIFVNGKNVGEHQGGNTPFSFDITQALVEGNNELVVRVEDATENWQLRGKQALEPRGIWYTQVSGIWQTVWLEQVGASRIEDLKISTDAKRGEINLNPSIAGLATRLRVVVRDDGDVVAEKTGEIGELSLQVKNAKLWSPYSPHLYDLEVSLIDESGKVVDHVQSYAGIRSAGKMRDASGNLRFTLNGEPLFHWGTLDQGWWPDGLLTPPSDEAMLYDIEFLKSAGFNMIRKHIKVEPRRYYYHCDRLGMLVWQDHVSGGSNPKWTRLQPGPQDADWPDEEHDQFMLELERMIATLESHPSIVVWVPFNEAWGQHRTMEVGQWLVQRDPARLVNVASGGNFWPAGNVVDAHKYPHPGFPFHFDNSGRFNKYIKVVGEFGGHGFPVAEHLWDEDRRNWGYGGLPKDLSELKQRYESSLTILGELRRRGIAAGVYTQTTDVEGEVNGLMTYDRKVAKLPAEQLADQHRRHLAPLNSPEGGAPQPLSELDAPESLLDGIESHDRALFIKDGWIRDPYITLGPDNYFYLTGTTPNPDNPLQKSEPFNTGLGRESIVGWLMQLWRSEDLINWEYLGTPFTLQDTRHFQRSPQQFENRGIDYWRLWAPEVHWLGDKWALVHCPKSVCSLALTKGADLAGPWKHPLGDSLGQKHDPSLFQDDDGCVYLLWGNTKIARLSSDLTSYASDPVRIDPAGSRAGPEGKPIKQIGHEGATLRKIGNKYVHFGTAWSTDRGRRGSYNLYYCTSDDILGPYGPRQFAGRFLGHGTPFQDKQGRWWCTAFFNANVPPVPKDGIESRDLRETAQTINQQGVTIVPLDVRVLESGEVKIRAKDPHYATPGPDEAQDFSDE